MHSLRCRIYRYQAARNCILCLRLLRLACGIVCVCLFYDFFHAVFLSVCSDMASPLCVCVCCNARECVRAYLSHRSRSTSQRPTATLLCQNLFTTRAPQAFPTLTRSLSVRWVPCLSFTIRTGSSPCTASVANLSQVNRVFVCVDMLCVCMCHCVCCV